MTVYAWPGWGVNAFELRILQNLRSFAGPYAPTLQVIDLMGERWQGRIDLVPSVDKIEIAAREAFWDRLKGQANQAAIWHFGLPVPNGTLRGGVPSSWENDSHALVDWVNDDGATVTWLAGDPAIWHMLPQGANTAIVLTLAGATLLAGDMLGFGGQTVRVMASAVADANGRMTIEFQPRARVTIPAWSAVTWNQPTINVALKDAAGVPTTRQPGFAAGASLEFIEVPA